jgi:hypothetical protein
MLDRGSLGERPRNRRPCWSFDAVNQLIAISDAVAARIGDDVVMLKSPEASSVSDHAIMTRYRAR